MDLLTFITEFISSMVENFALGTSASYALGFAFLCLVLLALRELMSWFLKTNHIHDEVFELNHRIKDLEALVTEQHKSLLQSLKPTEEKKSESVLPDPVNEKFDLEIEKKQKEQFPLQ